MYTVARKFCNILREGNNRLHSITKQQICQCKPRPPIARQVGVPCDDVLATLVCETATSEPAIQSTSSESCHRHKVACTSITTSHSPFLVLLPSTFTHNQFPHALCTYVHTYCMGHSTKVTATLCTCRFTQAHNTHMQVCTHIRTCHSSRPKVLFITYVCTLFMEDVQTLLQTAILPFYPPS